MTVPSPTDTATPLPVAMTLVTSPACHLCEHAGNVLAAVARQYPIDLQIIDLRSPEGASLQAHWRAPFPPMLLIGGDLFGFGRISQKKLERHLAALTEES